MRADTQRSGFFVYQPIQVFFGEKKMRIIFKFPNRKFKSIWWMPRLKKATKDVAWRRYVSGRCQATFDPEISEWGNPSK
jgi:hypothetical protein